VIKNEETVVDCQNG